MAEPGSARPWRWRSWLRAIHRDVGYLLVGLTYVYALSGLALNHINDWDPNHTRFEHEVSLAAPLPPDDAEAVSQVMEQLQLEGEALDVFRYEQELEFQLADEQIIVDGEAGTILHRGQRPRPILRVSNWMHAQRGKKAWNVVGDSYAILLLLLATSGVFMLPGRRGLRGRGALWVGLGIAIPVLYVVLSGGPQPAIPGGAEGSVEPPEAALGAGRG